MSEIKITPELLADLKAKAEAATPGSWEYKENDEASYHIFNTNGMGGVVWSGRDSDFCDCTYGIEKEANAAYIAAANPQVMLALIYILEQLKGMYGVSIKEISALDKEIEELEQDNASLENEADWLASELARFCSSTTVVTSYNYLFYNDIF